MTPNKLKKILLEEISEERLDKVVNKKLSPIAQRMLKYGSSLRCQGINNELIHHINRARKVYDLHMTDKVRIYIKMDHPFLETYLNSQSYLHPHL